MTHDDELIDRVARAMLDAPICDGTLRGNLEVHFGGEYETMAETAACARMVEQMMRGVSQAAIAAVRAYDAERRASVLDVDALKSFDPKSPGTLVWLPDGMPSIPTHDPDDYRDLPVGLVEPVRFKGGLTEGKP